MCMKVMVKQGNFFDLPKDMHNITSLLVCLITLFN